MNSIDYFLYLAIQFYFIKLLLKLLILRFLKLIYHNF